MTSKSFVIGTDETCDVRVNGDPYVSNRHARVWADDTGAVWIEDLGSTNGTFIQRAGQPTPRHPAFLARVRGKTRINQGDTIWLTKQTAIPWDR
jgi:pSer/pThr/pTyr-binding forkhead associated (FHA) protein